MENSLNFNVSSSVPEVEVGGDSRSDVDRTTKKVHFKDGIVEENNDMLTESSPVPSISWKDKLLGVNTDALNKNGLIHHEDCTDEELDFLEGDVHSLWSPSKPFHLMDIENGYFLAKFQSTTDYAKVLSQGPWLIYRQYLNVQPWIKEFTPFQPYPTLVMAWIRFPCLPSFLYKKKILEEIEATVGKVVRLDLNTDSKTRGRFARMAVYVNLEKPLIAQVIVNGTPQKVVYEGLPIICFTCGRYEHSKECCGFSNPSAILGVVILIKPILREEGIQGPRFDALANMEKVNLENGIHKKKDEQSVDFNNTLKAGKFLEQLRAKIRATQVQRITLRREQWSRASTATSLINVAASPSKSMMDMDSSCSVNTQPTGVLDSLCTETSTQVIEVGESAKTLGCTSQFNETGVSPKPLTAPVSNILADAGSSKLVSNCSNLNSLNFYCFNPVFVRQETSKDEAPLKLTKNESSKLDLVDIQIDELQGGLNSSRHTAVSFKEKGKIEEDHSKRTFASDPGGNKFQTLEKLVGNKNGDFRATKKINKTTHGKWVNLKSKNSPKLPLRDSMFRIAQSVSIVRIIDSETLGLVSGKGSQA
ncbi:hypothetical protein GOBAR_AA06041 [Gossypium barbadense]|uniref:DUF4283 domain-containing protein n=1 Tax=Gossypium barbadense TaxID=3634 RepID=A0A2P5YG03_GOSBA|nr:hypothetical protein GOBAR_AA06041 [Gossypium barbadense]